MTQITLNELHKQLESAQDAYNTLEQWFKIYENNDELQRDGIIQRFEYSVEILRKTLKLYLEFKWVEIEIISAKSIFRLAHRNKIVTDIESCIDMVECRNRLSHLYSKPDSDDIFDYIQEHYTIIEDVLQQLKLKLKNE
jgi:nucleotidyltransferase substrate binding protein (TIGR01987 family)